MDLRSKLDIHNLFIRLVKLTGKLGAIPSPRRLLSSSRPALALNQNQQEQQRQRLCNRLPLPGNKSNNNLWVNPRITKMSYSTDIVKNRFLRFFIWQSIHATITFILFSSALSQNGILSPPSLLTCLSFLTFHFSLLLFSASLSFISSPHPDRPSSPYDLALAIFRFLFSSQPPPQAFLRRARVFLGLFGFLLEVALAGMVALVSLCKSESCGGGVAVVGLRGFGFGLVYGIHYVFKRRWVLEFPIIQVCVVSSLLMSLPPLLFPKKKKLSRCLFIINIFVVSNCF